MSSFDKIPPQLWMLASHEERVHIAHAFDLKKTGITEIRDNDVISDGYNSDDLSAITSEKMSEYVGSEESFPRLWELTVAKARAELHPPVGVMRSENGGIVIDEVKQQEEAVQEYEKTDVEIEQVPDAGSDEVAPTTNPKPHAKRNTKKD